MKCVKTPSLIVAALLQVLPLTRAAVPLVQGSTNVIAIVIRWAGAMTAALGGVHAVAGASTFITSSMKPTAKQGQLFSLRLTTAPDPAHFWTATGLPADIKLIGTSGSTSWRLEGTPSAAGTFNIFITAKDKASSGSDRTVSGTMVLTVTGTGTAPSITTPPQDLTLLSGQDGSLSVVAAGTAPLGYRWRRNGATVVGGTNATLALTQANAATAGNYDVVVTNTVGSVTSRVAAVTVILPPAITGQPQPLTLGTGASGQLKVVAAGTGPLSYQWRHQGAKVDGGTTDTLTWNAITLNDGGDYDVVVANAAGSVTSQVAVVTVVLPPVIATQPQPLTLAAGGSGLLTVLAESAAPLTYQWRRNAGALIGGTNASLEITSFSAEGVGDYDVVVANLAGAVTSQVARVALQVDVPLVIEVSASAVGSGYQLSFKAQPGHSYRVEATDDLVGQAWVKIQDIAAGAEVSTQVITDPDAPKHAQRFYRVVAP